MALRGSVLRRRPMLGVKQITRGASRDAAAAAAAGHGAQAARANAPDVRPVGRPRGVGPATRLAAIKKQKWICLVHAPCMCKYHLPAGGRWCSAVEPERLLVLVQLSALMCRQFDLAALGSSKAADLGARGSSVALMVGQV
eukprot:1157751-Pelagomonas_calceolata.AAC.9